MLSGLEAECWLEHGEQEAEGFGRVLGVETRSCRALKAFVRTLASTLSEVLATAKFICLFLAVPLFIYLESFRAEE